MQPTCSISTYPPKEWSQQKFGQVFLRHIFHSFIVPWLCVGYFNEIISVAEKSSSSYRSPRQMQQFKKALEDCNLSDLGFLGPRFAQSNGRYESPDFTRERLDRAVANGDWSNLYDVVEVNVLPRNISDHNPLLVSFSNTRDVQWGKSKMFRYEASQVKQKETQHIIKQGWRVKQSTNNPWKIVNGNLLSCQQSLKQWVQKNSCPMEVQIKRK